MEIPPNAGGIGNGMTFAGITTEVCLIMPRGYNPEGSCVFQWPLYEKKAFQELGRRHLLLQKGSIHSGLHEYLRERLGIK